jgi:putative phosphoribosyl transferase
MRHLQQRAMYPGHVFGDREEAGRILGGALQEYSFEHPIVLGLPRGGVAVAAAVAHALGAPLDVIVVRKLGVPGQPELAMGALGEGGVCVLNHALISAANIGSDEIKLVRDREEVELQRRVVRFRNGREPIVVAGRNVIVVDDGIATGATAHAALDVVRAAGARRVVLAVPVAAEQSIRDLEGLTDVVVALCVPDELSSVGQWYRNFEQVTDDAVVDFLRLSRADTASRNRGTNLAAQRPR